MPHQRWAGIPDRDLFSPRALPRLVIHLFDLVGPFHFCSVVCVVSNDRIRNEPAEQLVREQHCPTTPEPAFRTIVLVPAASLWRSIDQEIENYLQSNQATRTCSPQSIPDVTRSWLWASSRTIWQSPLLQRRPLVVELARTVASPVVEFPSR